MSKKPLLSVKKLSVEIHKKGIDNGKDVLIPVDQISFDIFPGEICGLVGKSGCGKTLTALSITGLLPHSARNAGSINFCGLELLTLSEKELCDVRGRQIAMIFQEPGSSLNPLMKTGKQITESLEIHFPQNNRRQNRLKAIELMKKLGLKNAEYLMETYPFMLSGGMCQRVMIALAMICGPGLLIADEPTTSLDIKTQSQIIELLKTINRETGTAMLFISHDLGIIRDLCGRVLVMHCGKIVEQGITEEVFTSPGHEYTRSLLKEQT